MPRFAGGRPPLRSQGFRLQIAPQIPVPNFEEGSTHVALDVSSFRSRIVMMLNNLTAILEKAEALAKERSIEENVLLNWRLTPDMFPFARQVQIAADFAKGTSARLAGAEAPSYADEEASFADLKRRIAKTIAFVKSFKPGDIDGSEDRDITLTVGGQEMHFKGEPYLLRFALPNFYFHATTAYGLMRACGVTIGKRDFIGAI